MKNSFAKSLYACARAARNWLTGNATGRQMLSFYARFRKYAYVDCACKSGEQLEASVIRLYHTIEKGLSYENYRAGFGKENVEKLLLSLERYAAKGDTNAFFYRTALSCMWEYVRKNAAHGLADEPLEARLRALPGEANDCGGAVFVAAPENGAPMDYKRLAEARHSIRHFSAQPVSLDLLGSAIRLAQHTPSACNRQCWRTRIVADRGVLETILANQNGNRGFGQEIDKLLVVTADLRAQQKGRELFQAYIDGGMYAQSVLNALYYYGIGSVPLSASLTPSQERNVRRAARLDDAEVLVLFIGVGQYPPEGTTTTRSARKPAVIDVL